MTAQPLPAEFLVDEAPLSDDDLEMYFNRQDADAFADPDYAAAPADTLPAARWRIDGPNTAAWAMAKYAEAEAELAELTLAAESYRERIAAWFDHRARGLQRNLSFFEGHLCEYALEVRSASGGRTKSVALPSGMVKTTESKPRVAVADEEALLDWAVDHLPEAVEVKQRIRLAELRGGARLLEVPLSLVCSPCACVCRMTYDGITAEIVAAWSPATAVICPQCEQEALVGQWLSSMLVAVDDEGEPIPGASVDPGGINAKVVTS